MKPTNFIATTFLVSLFLCLETTASRLHHSEPNQIRKGHLALPSSQQTGPLYGFGQNIVDKGDRHLFLYVDSLLGPTTKYTELVPSLLYGISNELSFFVELPVVTQFKQGSSQSSGLGNLLAQLEYAFYSKESMTATNQATLVGAVTLPTGKALILHPRTVRSPNVFIGVTVSHLDIDWYFFTSEGLTIAYEHQKIKSGNSVLCQFGVARAVGNVPGWIFAPMVELFGTYTQRAKIKGTLDANSGGNTFLVGPSFWASSERFIAQAGVGFVVAEHLFGNQPANKFYPAAQVGWKF